MTVGMLSNFVLFCKWHAVHLPKSLWHLERYMVDQASQTGVCAHLSMEQEQSFVTRTDENFKVSYLKEPEPMSCIEMGRLCSWL